MELVDFKIEFKDEADELPSCMIMKMKVNCHGEEKMFGVKLAQPINLQHASEALKAMARKIDGLYLNGLVIDEKEKLPNEVD